MNTLKTKLLSWYPMTCFGVDEEALFWQERHSITLKVLNLALLLGMAGFLAILILDIHIKHLSAMELICRILIVMALAGLFCWLNFINLSQSQTCIASATILATSISAIGLIRILLGNANPALYGETWPGLLPIYFITYGQLVMPVGATLFFGALSLIALPLTGYLIGVEVSALLPSCLMLLFANIFGLYTRCQLEAYSRKSFKMRLTAEAAAEDKASFIRQASHNLRQPLQALCCYSSVLDNALDRNHIEEVCSTAAKLGSIIDELNDSFNRILDITNLETGKQVPFITKVELNPLLAKLENQYVPQAAKKGLKLKVHLRTRPPYTVQSDPIILWQILSNLMDNAIKYTACGWILLGTTSVSPTQVEVHVRDTGIGIPEGQSEAIFKEFHRAHRRRNDLHTHGLGIGLAYVRAATDCLPGHFLQFQAKLSRGMDFQLKLPAVAAPSRQSQLPAQAQDRLAGLYVLLVDDDEDVLNALAGQLHSWECLVEKVMAMDELRQLLSESYRPPDLLITDFYLGRNETAHDVIAAVEAECGPVPTLILSARAISAVDKKKWSDAVLLLRKPANAMTLLETMTKAMGQSN
ncbi:MAG: ATP-binding protein [Methylococcales bacterium]|nr:ATP-binding protein [Methylococcales bacterium]MDD5632874.1 ATP-binding protein [Methylococcales bacterium]